METKSCNEIDSDESLEENVDISRVTTIVSSWVFDFCFSGLCRLFQQRKRDEFNHTMGTLDAICQGCKFSKEQAQRKKIAVFLGRIMNGQQLDLVYGKGNLMPLMAATCAWNTLRDTVADEDSYQGISTLLHIQSVVVCLEQGQKNMASTALQWLEKKQDIPKNLAIKLFMLVAKGNIYHPFISKCSYEHLLEKVQAYLDAFLEGKPASDFLLKAATQVAKSGLVGDAGGNQASSSSSCSSSCSSSSQTTHQPPPAAKENSTLSRPKKRQLATKQAVLWLPESAKKPRKSVDDGPQGSVPLTEMPPNQPPSTARRGKKEWTDNLDKLLHKGVRKHGEGNWKLILLDHNFQGRTGTMLKDRWRILKRNFIF